MSLTKLFNYRYFIENLKKSKSIVGLFLLILPLFTVLILIDQGNKEVYTYDSLASINMFFALIIPLVLSQVLFGYVYKQKSVDFMGSMPISRKSIFLSNTIGGIILIVLIQLITLILTLISSCFVESVIFPGLAFNVFLMQTLSYIFIFCLSNLAVSLSGNIMTSLAVALLIFAVYPVTKAYICEESRIYLDIGAKASSAVSNEISLNDNYEDFTLPLLTLGLEGRIPVLSVVKTIALTIIYTAIGMHVFNKRKMEMAGESFIKDRTHLLVKALTLIPFAIFFLTVEPDIFSSESLIMCAVIFVYWQIYDLVTVKKIKFLKSVGVLVVSFVAVCGIMLACMTIRYRIHYTIDDIKYITISNSEIYPMENGYELLEASYKVTNKEDIKKIITESKKVYDGSVYTSSIKESYNSEKPSSGSKTYKCSVRGVIKGNKSLNVTSLVEKNEMKDIISRAEKEENTWELISNARIINKFNATREEEEKIFELLKNEKPISIRKNLEYYYDLNDTSSISVVQYRNHRVELYKYPVDNNLELIKIVDEISRRKLKDDFEAEKDMIFVRIIEQSSELVSENDNSYFLSSYDYEYLSERSKWDNFSEYLKSTILNEVLDYSKPISYIEIELEENKKGRSYTLGIRTNRYHEIKRWLEENNMIHEKEYFYDIDEEIRDEIDTIIYD